MIARLVLALVLLALPVRAEMPAGADDPAFADARDRWLAADDSAYDDLHRLAGEGNAAALILYVRIRGRDGRMDKRKKIDPFWLDFVETSELARAFGLSWSRLPERSPQEHAAELFRLGEYRAAAIYIQDVLRRGENGRPVMFPQDQLDVLLSDAFDPMSRFFHHFHPATEKVDQWTKLRRWAELCELADGGQLDLPPLEAMCAASAEQNEAALKAVLSASFTGLAFDDPDLCGRRMITDWLTSDADLPHGKICRAACPGIADECVWEVFLDNGLIAGLVGTSTPVETLITHTDYMHAHRAVRERWETIVSLLRLKKERGKTVEEFSAVQQCLLEAADRGTRPWEQAE